MRTPKIRCELEAKMNLHSTVGGSWYIVESEVVL